MNDNSTASPQSPLAIPPDDLKRRPRLRDRMKTSTCPTSVWSETLTRSCCRATTPPAATASLTCTSHPAAARLPIAMTLRSCS